MSAPNGQITGLFDGLATRLRSTELRAVGFTSAVFGEGASTVALGTAVSLASLEHSPVLLVDANWLHPSLTHDARATDCRGLTEVLRGEVVLDEVLVSTGRPRLRFLAAGELNGERPEPDALASFLKHALSSFGTVIVDLPPALAGEPVVLPWAVSLQQLFIVVRSEMTPLALVRRVIGNVGLERPQVVLNRTPAWTSGRAVPPRLATT
jgi:Mrp family chromosome partitioning ATPase